MSRVVVFGSLNTDITVVFERLPRPGESRLGDSLRHDVGAPVNASLEMV